MVKSAVGDVISDRETENKRHTGRNKEPRNRRKWIQTRPTQEFLREFKLYFSIFDPPNLPAAATTVPGKTNLNPSRELRY